VVYLGGRSVSTDLLLLCFESVQCAELGTESTYLS
jgi:hypothetical protein